ncbi:MAG: hypothetical protein Kow0090_14460 [Myxococcota bacterium]
MGKDLAYAEAHYEFAQEDLREGKWLKAEEDMAIARRHSKIAMDGADPDRCLPKKVVVMAPPPPPPPKDPCLEPDPSSSPPDSDGDGLDDCIDKCPNDPGAPNNNGCPWGDRDGDKIIDPQDACPDEPGLPEFQGCPDRDGDGVPDKEDKCPDEPGVPELDGCPPPKYKKIVVNIEEGEIEIKEQVHFEYNKDVIKPESFPLLAEIADAINTIPKEYRISVEGHTDSTGSDAYNKKLSDRRANSVVKHLTERHGIDRRRLQAIGWGEERPIASNRTERGKQMNRRVEFLIIDETGQRVRKKKQQKQIEIETTE